MKTDTELLAMIKNEPGVIVEVITHRGRQWVAMDGYQRESSQLARASFLLDRYREMSKALDIYRTTPVTQSAEKEWDLLLEAQREAEKAEK